MATQTNEPPDRPLMTMRVSRDGGRTWSPVREIRPDDCDLHPWEAIVWPPCACPLHRNGTN